MNTTPEKFKKDCDDAIFALILLIIVLVIWVLKIIESAS